MTDPEPASAEGQWVLRGAELDRTVARLAHELVERMPEGFALVGIVTGGHALALRLADAVAGITGRRPPVGSVDITLYRDDLTSGLEKPILGDTDLPFEVGRSALVLVDDVLFTGRTVRAALDEIMDYGRPRMIRLAVLVDRGHRELPIAADFVGRRLDTGRTDRVEVIFTGGPDGRGGVELRRGRA